MLKLTKKLKFSGSDDPRLFLGLTMTH